MCRRIAVLLVLGLAACATQGTGPGVSASQINETTVEIAVRGPAANDRNQALLKAAQETMRLGFDLFVVVAETDRSRNAIRVIPTVTTVMGTPDGGATTVSGGETEFIPGRDYTIEMRRGTRPLNAPANLYDARALIALIAGQQR
jgi:hypothetical protein